MTYQELKEQAMGMAAVRQIFTACAVGAQAIVPVLAMPFNTQISESAAAERADMQTMSAFA